MPDSVMKARLLGFGKARIDPSITDLHMMTTATAGPGAGGTSVFVRWGEQRVRLSVDDNSPLSIVPDGDGIAVMHGDEMLLHGELEEPLCHCPGQAYITLSERCVMNCLFCPVPKINGGVKDIGTVMDIVGDAWSTGKLRAVSLTSGIEESAEKEVKRAANVAKAILSEYDLPVGVSVYPTATSSEELYAAGASEVKYNIETPNQVLFRRICPEMDLRDIINSLGDAVRIFGRNYVTSNIILGLGESDDDVRRGIYVLAGMGVIPVLRPVSPHPLRRNEIAVKRPGAERLIRLGRIERMALLRNGLRTDLARTMCLPCTGCDLTPFKDI
ncbi:MAG: radical SAM protein [Methanoregulaceae archaeon]|nr:radical SAM protein [Methanoregulaceae archaeon]